MNIERSQKAPKPIAVVAHNLDFGGAAVACKRLVAAFKQEGHDVTTHLVRGNEFDSTGSIPAKLAKILSGLRSRADQILCKFLEPENDHWSSSGLIGQIKSTKITQHKPLFVNFHWVGHATISLRQISKIDIPVLITAHDEWWLNATSHYSESVYNGKKFFVKKQILKKIVRKKAEILRKKNVGIVCLNKEMAENFLVNFIK